VPLPADSTRCTVDMTCWAPACWVRRGCSSAPSIHQAAFLVVPGNFLPAFSCNPIEHVLQMGKTVKLNGKALSKSRFTRCTHPVIIILFIRHHHTRLFAALTSTIGDRTRCREAAEPSQTAHEYFLSASSETSAQHQHCLNAMFA
jgi:hypothetical protein